MEEEAPPRRRSYAHEEKLHQGGGGSAHSPSCWSLSSVATTEGRGTAPLVSTVTLVAVVTDDTEECGSYCVHKVYRFLLFTIVLQHIKVDSPVPRVMTPGVR